MASVTLLSTSTKKKLCYKISFQNKGVNYDIDYDLTLTIDLLPWHSLVETPVVQVDYDKLTDRFFYLAGVVPDKKKFKEVRKAVVKTIPARLEFVT